MCMICCMCKQVTPSTMFACVLTPEVAEGPKLSNKWTVDSDDEVPEGANSAEQLTAPSQDSGLLIFSCHAIHGCFYRGVIVHELYTYHLLLSDGPVVGLHEPPRGSCI